MVMATAAKVYQLTLTEVEASALLGALNCVQVSDTTASRVCEEICAALYEAGARGWEADGAISFTGADDLPD